MSMDGENYALMSRKMGQGYKELYYTAPYHWALINPKTKKIFSYTEGDTAEVSCDSKSSFIKEAKSYIAFMKKTGHHSSTYAEGDALVKKLKG